MIKIKASDYEVIQLKTEDVVVFDCYDDDWKATGGEIVGFEQDGSLPTPWIWLRCSDGSLRKRQSLDVVAGLMRKVF